jgi:HEAT repeat protein
MENWAIIIGVDNYQHHAKLKNAVADAKLVHQTITRDYGFAREHVSSLFDRAATRSHILRIIQDVIPRRWKVGNRDQLLVFFAGHGGMAKKKGKKTWYLVPSDGKRVSESAAHWDTVITRDDIRALENKFRGAQIFYVFDCCYAGMAFSYQAPAHRTTPLRSVHALVAGKGGETVNDEGGTGHSIFTQSLVEAFNGWGGLSSSADGSFIASDLVSFIRRDVPAQIAKKGLRPVQTPFGGPLRGNTDGIEYVFRPIHPRLSNALVSLLLHQYVAARREGVRQLADLPDEQLGYLKTLAFSRMALDTSPAVRAEVAFRLFPSLDRAAGPLLLQMLTDKDQLVLTTTLKAIPHIRGIASKAIPLVRNLSLKSGGAVKRASWACLALLGVRTALRAVVSQLPTEQGSIRREIIDVLKHLEETAVSKGTLTTVLNPLMSGDNWRSRRAAAEAAGELGLHGASEALVKFARSSAQHYMVRYASVEALGHLGQASARPVIFNALLNDRSLLVRTAAGEAVGSIGGIHAVDCLASAILRDLEWRVRRSAAESCGVLRDSGALDSLVRASDDPHFRVRVAVVEALGEIGDERSKKVLERLARLDPSRFVKNAANRSLQLLNWNHE